VQIILATYLANDDEFKVKGTFTLGKDSNGIDPTTEAVNLRVGTFSTTIPAGSFIQDEKLAGTEEGRGGLVFEGVINQVALSARIQPLHDGTFKFKISAKGADLSGTSIPLALTLTLGDDRGSTSLTQGKAEFGKGEVKSH
jgi:hypothetical protein